jgi:hypothetical protein
MNCQDECRTFFQNKTQKNLGDIKKSNDCANCLYWKAGPGKPIYQYSLCDCNNKMLKITEGGRKMSLQDYYGIVDCLENAKNKKTEPNEWEKYKVCGVLYSNFTNKTYYNPNSKGMYFKKFYRNGVM